MSSASSQWGIYHHGLWKQGKVQVRPDLCDEDICGLYSCSHKSFLPQTAAPWWIHCTEVERQNGPESEGRKIALTTLQWPEKAFRYFSLKTNKCHCIRSKIKSSSSCKEMMLDETSMSQFCSVTFNQLVLRCFFCGSMKSVLLKLVFFLEKYEQFYHLKTNKPDFYIIDKWI